MELYTGEKGSHGGRSSGVAGVQELQNKRAALFTGEQNSELRSTTRGEGVKM
jgi:hypothetical protein